MTTRGQIYEIFRNLKWIVAIALVISVALYLPDQVRELYRISAGDGGLTLAKQFIAIFAVAAFIWFGTSQLATETTERIEKSTTLEKWPSRILRFLPAMLGFLPIAATSFAQLEAIPSTDNLAENVRRSLQEVGNVFRVHHLGLADDIFVLKACFVLFALLAAAALVAFLATGARIRDFSKWANENYFTSYWFLALTVMSIAALTAIFIVLPDAAAQQLGTFGVVALFTLCIVAFCIHVSLLTIRHHIPYFPLLFGIAIVFGIFGEKDNHHIRTATTEKSAAPPPPRQAAARAFEHWLTNAERSKEAEARASGEPYPVFVVSAQGGGIYAAYNIATFLARIQDICPSFRRHLFAVSSVSGGSVGAAVFAAALHDHDQQQKRKALLSAQPATTCAKIGEFLASTHNTRDMDKEGDIEAKVQSVLSRDYLSPLVGASLFPDFTQNFLPFPVRAFDRARALEYSLENAMDDASAVVAAADPLEGKSEQARKQQYQKEAQEKEAERKQSEQQTIRQETNLLKRPYQDHWTSDNRIPALLMNATDAGSGKRVLIAPFDINPAHPKGDDLCMLANVGRKRIDGVEQVESSTSQAFPLSTAAFISARFPWVTPAATVDINNSCVTELNRARLVDGGYIDNSGVETALNLIEKLETVANNPRMPKFIIHHISLSGGDFPDRTDFSMGEILEPIRALLNGRTSRAYIALNRASARAKIEAVVPPAFLTFNRSDLRNHFYRLPLGWALSAKTRHIVALNSGRFWDCEPNATFSQLRSHLSNADCLQIQIYHLLNGSKSAATKLQKGILATSGEIERLSRNESPAAVKRDHQTILACYEEQWFQKRARSRRERQEQDLREKIEEWKKERVNVRPQQLPPYREPYLTYFQSENLRALLHEWDRQLDADPALLAYVLGSISYDSADFSRMTENLVYAREDRIPRKWRERIQADNDVRKAKGESPIDLKSLENNPEGLANAVWGQSSDYGNKNEGDGWRYRARGLYQIVGYEQYKKTEEARKASTIYRNFSVNILESPDAVWHRNVAAKVAFIRIYSNRLSDPSKKSAPRTVVQLVKDYPGDWEKVRSHQSDMNFGPQDQRQVSDRTKMFLRCIDKAGEVASPPSMWTSASANVKTLAKRILGRK